MLRASTTSPTRAGTARRASLLAVALLATASAMGASKRADEERLDKSSTVLRAFARDPEKGIPIQLLERARGIVVIPGLLRGGFIVGGRRGRGVMTVRTASGQWSNPAFVTLTGGSVGWQIGLESHDVVLVFANDRSIENIENGRMTFGGDAAAVAGPVGQRSTVAVTGKQEVYIYVRSRGLFAGASFEGARLDVDQDTSAEYYAADPSLRPLGERGPGTPAGAARFLDDIGTLASVLPASSTSSSSAPSANPPAERVVEEAIIYPLE